MEGIDKNKYNFVRYNESMNEYLLSLLKNDAMIKRFLSGDIDKNNYIIFYENNMIGFYSVSGYPTGELQLGIFEEYRGKGHGKELTIKITEECFDENYGAIILRCDKDNLISQASAKACGFMRDYEGELDYGERDVQYITYYKRNYNYNRAKRF